MMIRRFRPRRSTRICIEGYAAIYDEKTNSYKFIRSNAIIYDNPFPKGSRGK